MRFNRVQWFMRSVRDGFGDLVSTLAHLADEHGFGTQEQIEAFYELEPGTLDDFFQGGDSILLTQPSPSETGG